MPPTVVSTIPAAKAALVDKIREAVAGQYPDMQVLYSQEHKASGIRIEVGDTFRGANTRTWKSLAARNPASKVEELYVLPITIFRPTVAENESMRDLAEYCFAVFALIDSMLRVPANVTLGVAGVIEVMVSAGTHEEIVTDQGFACKLHSAVQIKARI